MLVQQQLRVLSTRSRLNINLLRDNKKFRGQPRKTPSYPALPKNLKSQSILEVISNSSRNKSLSCLKLNIKVAIKDLLQEEVRMDIRNL